MPPSPEALRAWVSAKVFELEGLADEVLIDMVCRRVALGGSAEVLDPRLLESDLSVLMDVRAGEFAEALCAFIGLPRALPPADGGGKFESLASLGGSGDESSSAAGELRREGSFYDGSVSNLEDDRSADEAEKDGGLGAAAAAEEEEEEDEDERQLAVLERWDALELEAMRGMDLEGATLPLSVKPCATTSGMSLLGSAHCAAVAEVEASPAGKVAPLSTAAADGMCAEDQAQLLEWLASAARKLYGDGGLPDPPTAIESSPSVHTSTPPSPHLPVH